MLRVEEHFTMKDMYRKGVSISEIARQTGHDRKTVRRLPNRCGRRKSSVCLGHANSRPTTNT